MNCIKGALFLLILLTKFTVSAQEKTLQSVAPFKVGCAINPYLLKTNKGYLNVVSNEFNSITAENVLKFYSLHPKRDVFTFTMGDTVVNFALANKKRMHGHCLVWHESAPKWLNEFEGDSTSWDSILKTHIQTVLTHYKGKMTSWDVVNEAFFDDGNYRTEKSNATRKSDKIYWYNHLGADYIAHAFQYAHEADPATLLFYNDYNQESSAAKLKAIIAMVTDFKQRGIPIHGLGLQMHINIKTKNEGIITMLKEVAKTGLLIHISELDISVNRHNDSTLVYNDSLKALQSEKFAFVVEQYKKLIPKKQQYGITCWNVGDADSWLVKWHKAKDWPLLFDKNYQRKECYTSFYNSLKK